MKTFEEAWKELGYNYGEDALEAVRLGWELRGQSEGVWERAVKDQLSIANLDWDEANPRKSIEALIAWHVSVVADPMVSELAARLLELNLEPVATVTGLDYYGDQIYVIKAIDGIKFSNGDTIYKSAPVKENENG